MQIFAAKEATPTPPSPDPLLLPFSLQPFPSANGTENWFILPRNEWPIYHFYIQTHTGSKHTNTHWIKEHKIHINTHICTLKKHTIQTHEMFMYVVFEERFRKHIHTQNYHSKNKLFYDNLNSEGWYICCTNFDPLFRILSQLLARRTVYLCSSSSLGEKKERPYLRYCFAGCQTGTGILFSHICKVKILF